MANQRTGQSDKRLVKIFATLVAKLEPTVLVNPTLRSFHDPAIDSHATAMSGSAAAQVRTNVTLAEFSAIRVRIISAITIKTLGTATRMSALAGHRRHGLDQLHQLGDVVAIGLGDRESQGDASFAIDQQMVFGAVFTAVHGAWPCFFPRCIARTEVESTTALDQSILPAAWSLCRSTRCRRFQTPLRCQSRRRRQQVMPLPQRISAGRYSQGMPVLSTYKIPLSTLRLLRGLRPACLRRRRLGGGSNGLINCHNRSSSICLAMARPPSVLTIGLKKSFC